VKEGGKMLLKDFSGNTAEGWGPSILGSPSTRASPKSKVYEVWGLKGALQEAC